MASEQHNDCRSCNPSDVVFPGRMIPENLCIKCLLDLAKLAYPNKEMNSEYLIQRTSLLDKTLTFPFERVARYKSKHCHHADACDYGLNCYFLHQGDDPMLNEIMKKRILPESINGLIASEAPLSLPIM
ncbi:hypothetical protein QL285_006998 [Trifolium repens]|nr:hypothetical protein QL285_006998 [Trifolium repens]